MNLYEIERAIEEAENHEFELLFEEAVNMMDDELREEIHREIAPCTDKEFLIEYAKRHYEKYGEEFMLP